MSKTQAPVSSSKIIGNGPLDKSQMNDEAVPYSITSGMILRRTVSIDIPVISKSLAAVPLAGSIVRLLWIFATVLEDVITQIWLLEKCNNELGVVKTVSDIEYLKSIKYGVCDPNEIKDELDGIDPRNLNCVIYKVRKLVADRKLVNEIMTATYMSLAESLNYYPLINGVASIDELHTYRQDLIVEESKNKMICREVCKQVRHQRNHNKTILYDNQVIIDKLNTKVEDSVLYTEVRSRYIENWQVARTEQHTQKILETEYGPATTIEYYKQRTDHELRVHTEVETLVSIAISETLAKVEEWMNKFDADMEAKELQIAKMKNKYQDELTRRMELEETYATHEVLMKNWLKFKKERQEAIDYWNKMTNSAIIVQAWWRGLLVRLEIGPYKPQKKKPKSKKK